MDIERAKYLVESLTGPGSQEQATAMRHEPSFIMHLCIWSGLNNRLQFLSEYMDTSVSVFVMVSSYSKWQSYFFSEE